MNGKYKVLNICSWYPNDLKPTLGNFVQKHAESIALYNDVIVLAIFPDNETKIHRISIQEKRNLTEIVIHYPKRSKGFKIFNLILNFLNHVKAFKIGFKTVKQKFIKPDIVHLNIIYPLGIWALWLKIRYGINYVITENSSGFHLNSSHAYPIHIMKLAQKIIKNSTFILPVSENLKNNLKKLHPCGKYEIISNVVDENLFVLSEFTNEKITKLIHISTGIDEIKNLSGMIRVFQRIKEENLKIHLDIVSDGDIEYAKKLVEELRLVDYISFHATKTTVEISEMIQQRDALLMFSNYENFPCVIAETLMCGKPVISSNVNGIPEHVNADNGFLVEPRDENALFVAIKRFELEKNNFNSTKIRDYALKNFSYTSVGQKFTHVYDEVLSN